MKRTQWWLVAVVAMVGCAPKEPVPITPAGEMAGAPVVRRAVADQAPATLAKAAPSMPAAAPPAALPADAVYVCVSESGGQRKETVIEFSPKVGALCRRHPEMGPCQYERDICRRSGGRVYAADGFEITNQVEAEYDKKVLRVRFKAN